MTSTADTAEAAERVRAKRLLMDEEVEHLLKMAAGALEPFAALYDE